MTSTAGRLFGEIARAAGNVNPITVEKKHKNLVHDLRSMEPLFPVYIAPKGYTYETVDVGGVPTEIFKKKNCNDKLIFVLHGGAYVSRMMFYYRWLNKKYCDACGGGTVIHHEYRCSPEAVYPAALEDTTKVWDYILSLGYKEENIIILGDSAGGHLCMDLMMKLHDTGRKQPKAAVMMSPWLDMTASGESYVFNYKNDPVFGIRGKTPEADEVAGLLMKSDLFGWFGDADRKDPYISPVYADIDGTYPPIFVTAGGHEMLLSDSETIVKKFRAAGIDARLHVGEGMFHAFPVYELFPEAQTALGLITDYIGEKFEIKQ